MSTRLEGSVPEDTGGFLLARGCAGHTFLWQRGTEKYSFFFVLFLFQDKVSPGYPGTCYTDQVYLKLRELPAFNP